MKKNGTSYWFYSAQFKVKFYIIPPKGIPSPFGPATSGCPVDYWPSLQ